MRLTGAEVVSADGARVLGKVRGYGFDPETGELLALRFDALGVPRIPEGKIVFFSFFFFLFPCFFSPSTPRKLAFLFLPPQRNLLQN